MSLVLHGLTINRDFMRDACNDDRVGWNLIHEGDDIVEYNDVVNTLHVVEHYDSGKQYGILVHRQGNPDDPIWTYEFLGEYEEREIVTTEWVKKKV